MSVLNANHFKDESAAYAFVEARVWAGGRVCPHCGVVGNSKPLKGKTTRVGLYKCYESKCRKPFSVKVGTIFEDSKIPMHIWLQGIALMVASKKGISSNQLHRILGISLKAAWFMSHRIREAMSDGSIGQLGGEGKTVEADETYLLKRDGEETKPGYSHKIAVLSFVERGGKIRSMSLDRKPIGIKSAIREHVDPASRLVTDGAQHFKGAPVASHQSVDHSKTYVTAGDVHTNTLEGFFSTFKRGMIGTYQRCEEKHLDRYLHEFDFRFSNRKAMGVDDQMRTLKALDGVTGKRLMYKDLTK